jgi:hypothetical protein
MRKQQIMSTMQSKLGIVCLTELVVSPNPIVTRTTLTFSDYGNEIEAGQGVARAIKDGLVKREELFIVSKLWNTFHEKERVEEACLKSLTDWGLDYLDLYIMHFRTLVVPH